MNRSRSMSRRPSFRRREYSPSPSARSQSHSPSVSSFYRAPRSLRSQSRAPGGSSSSSSSKSHHHHHQHNRLHLQRADNLTKSAGVLAGIGIAALVAYKFWPKGRHASGRSSGKDDSRDVTTSDHGGDARHRRSSRGHRQPSDASDHYHHHGDGGGGGGPSARTSMKTGQVGGCAGEPRRRSMNCRSWGGEDVRGRAFQYRSTSPERSSMGYSRRHS